MAALAALVGCDHATKHVAKTELESRPPQQLLGSVLEAFWWQRFTLVGDVAMTPAQVEQVVDEVLLPVAEPERATAPV